MGWPKGTGKFPGRCLQVIRLTAAGVHGVCRGLLVDLDGHREAAIQVSPEAQLPFPFLDGGDLLQAQPLRGHREGRHVGGTVEGIGDPQTAQLSADGDLADREVDVVVLEAAHHVTQLKAEAVQVLRSERDPDLVVRTAKNALIKPIMLTGPAVALR